LVASEMKAKISRRKKDAALIVDQGCRVPGCAILFKETPPIAGAGAPSQRKKNYSPKRKLARESNPTLGASE